MSILFRNNNKLCFLTYKFLHILDCSPPTLSCHSGPCFSLNGEVVLSLGPLLRLSPLLENLFPQISLQAFLVIYLNLGSNLEELLSSSFLLNYPVLLSSLMVITDCNTFFFYFLVLCLSLSPIVKGRLPKGEGLLHSSLHFRTKDTELLKKCRINKYINPLLCLTWSKCSIRIIVIYHSIQLEAGDSNSGKRRICVSVSDTTWKIKKTNLAFRIDIITQHLDRCNLCAHTSLKLSSHIFIKSKTIMLDYLHSKYFHEYFINGNYTFI